MWNLVLFCVWDLFNLFFFLHTKGRFGISWCPERNLPQSATAACVYLHSSMLLCLFFHVKWNSAMVIHIFVLFYFSWYHTILSDPQCTVKIGNKLKAAETDCCLFDSPRSSSPSKPDAQITQNAFLHTGWTVGINLPLGTCKAAIPKWEFA